MGTTGAGSSVQHRTWGTGTLLDNNAASVVVVHDVDVMIEDVWKGQIAAIRVMDK